MQPQEPVAQPTQTLTRRRALVGAGTATATVLGGLSLTLTAEPALAAEIDSLEVSGDHAELADAPSALPVDVSVDYSGDAGGETIDQLLFTLQVLGSSSGSEETDELDTDAAFDLDGSFEGTMNLSGDLLDHRAFDAGDLDVDSGETVSVEPQFEVVAEAQVNGSVAHEAVAVDTAEITVEGGQVVGVVLDASGSVSVEA